MTLLLELPSELETRVRADAEARGLTPEAAALEAVARIYSKPTREPDKTKRPQPERLALARSLRGRAKGRGPTVDEFLSERSREAQAEGGAQTVSAPLDEATLDALDALLETVPQNRVQAGLPPLSGDAVAAAYADYHDEKARR